MQTYQSTPDYYRDYIEHGYLKDQAAKVHKYIERWRGKNGKWYYRYKSKAQELEAKAKRKEYGYDDDTISTDGPGSQQHGGLIWQKKWSKQVAGHLNRIKSYKDSGKATSKSRLKWAYSNENGPVYKPNNSGTGVVKTTKVSSKVSRKPKKKGNLTSRGYSDSKSSSNNKATGKKIARREHMDYLKSNSVRNTVYGWEKNPNGSIIDKETGKRYTPYKKRRKTNKYK